MNLQTLLATEEELTMDMLKDYTRIYYSDIEFDIVPTDEISRTIGINERGTMVDILENSTNCYLWTISTHPNILVFKNHLILKL